MNTDNIVKDVITKTSIRSKLLFIRRLDIALLLCSGVISSTVLYGQYVTKADREASYYRYLKIHDYIKGSPPRIQWTPDGMYYWYTEANETSDSVYKIGAVTTSKSLVQDKNDLAAFRYLEEAEHSTEKGIRSPNGEWHALIKENNLWLSSSGSNNSIQITADGKEDHAWIITPNARRLGTFWTGSGGMWSPGSNKLALKKIDARKVEMLSFVHFENMPVKAEQIKFAIPGSPIFQTELFVLDVKSKNIIQLKTGDEKDYRYEFVGWRNDDNELLFLRLNRLHNKLQLMVADVNTGNIKSLLTETATSFVVGPGEWFHESVFTSFKNSNQFIWISERDGWRHFYLYNAEGKLIRQLTKGNFPVMHVVDIDEVERWLYFMAHGEEYPYDTHLYRVDLDGKRLQRLTMTRGQHKINFSSNYKFFFDTHSHLDRPPSVDLHHADGKFIRTIWTANADSLKVLNWRPPEEFIVKAADNTTNLHGILFKPSYFNPANKYPVLDAVDDDQLSGLMHFTSWPYLQAMAEQGFIVFVVNERGIPGRSKSFRDVAYKNIGRDEIQDHVATLHQLAKRHPYIDTSRVGIFGGSKGGYITLRAMLTAPDVFHVGVADSPDVDLMHDDYFYFEPIMGLPEDNPEGYDYASNLRLAGNLKGKLLMMVGTGDFGIYPGTMAMVAALTKVKKPYDLIVLPGQPHQYFGAGGQYARDSNARYLIRHLIGEDFDFSNSKQ